MKRSRPMLVSQIVERLIKDQNLEKGLLQQRVLAAWPEVAGPLINRLTLERRIADGILYLRINSAAVRQELSMQRSMLVETLNRRAGADILTDIRFI